ncbi:MAG: ADOP family duplicated permease [Vicinamibacteraceae bacterium]
MNRLRVFLSRLRALARGSELDRDLQEQINAHLEEATDEYVQQGLPLKEARRRALRDFGGVLQLEEAYRDMRSFGWLEDARRDMRYTFRALRRTPGFTAVAVLTLALAIGAGTAIFSVIDAALLRPVPYQKPEEIVSVNVGEAFDYRLAPSAIDVEQWRTATKVFVRIGMGRERTLAPIIVDAGVPERLMVGTASEDFLEVFGILPILGRAFTANDRRPGSPLVVLLGHRYWQTRLNGARDVIGRSILVEGDQATIVGVLPAGFYPDTMVWRPEIVPPIMRAMRGTGVSVYGRLRPGMDIDSAARDLTARLAAAEETPDLRVWLVSLYAETTRSYGRTIAVLSGAVALILLIACVNVAGLLLARGATRQSELAIRKAIGASRWRLIRQLLAESVLLAAAGGIVGVILAFLALDAIVALIPLRLPDNVTPVINPQALAFGLMLSMATAIAFGLAPALKLSGTNVNTRAAVGRSRHGSALTRRGGQVLIAVEVAMALVLVIGAALMIRSLSKILAIDVGFDPDAVLTMEVVPVDTDPAAQEAYYRELLRNVRQIPGIAVAGAADRPPLDGSGSYTSATANGRSTNVALRRVMPGYFEAIGLPLRQGRFPTDADYRTSPPFAVLSESAARAMFPDQPAVGQQFILQKKTWIVVGVVGNARNKSPLPGEREERDLYLAHQADASSAFGPGLAVAVRPVGPIPQLAEQLRRAAHAVGPAVIVERVRSGRDLFADRVATPRQQTTMLSLLGGLGLLLALVGIFGTTAYAVARRTQEVGIRMALGARPGRMVGTIVGDAAWPVALGIAIGLASAVVVTRVIASFLFETEPTDPLTLGATIVVLAVTALMAAWIPARHAAHVDPVKALRAE